MKSTQIKVAKQLNGLIKLRNRPLYVGRYSLSLVLEKNTKGQFYNFRIANAGVVETEEQQKALKALFEELKDKSNLAERVHREGDAAEDTSFNTDEM